MDTLPTGGFFLSELELTEIKDRKEIILRDRGSVHVDLGKLVSLEGGGSNKIVAEVTAVDEDPNVPGKANVGVRFIRFFTADEVERVSRPE